MGKVKEKPKTFKESIHPIPEGKKPLPTPDTNPVDGDKLIKETKPKKTKEEVPEIDPLKEISEDMGFVFKELTMITNWIADIETKLNKAMRRLGLHG